ncbi:MAG TPA: TraY domain-containing protein [Acidobacteriaceae bacterium]
MIAVRLSAEIETRLDKLARRTGRTKTFYVREAIINQLDDLEDIYLAEHSLANIESGKSRTTALTEVLKRHGLAD